jgi:uncharacterized protein YecT (DUF1311 family)
MIYQCSVTVAMALAAIVGAAHASPLTQAATSDAYAACMDKSGGVTSMMEDCISEEFDLQDLRLNSFYTALMASIPEKHRPKLRDAQRKWIAFRDASCGFYYDPEGGSAARVASKECVVTLTADRADELATLKARIGEAIGERPMPGMGYELFWDGKRVNGHEAASYSRQEARDNCAWNTRTYPRLSVTCFYNGEPFTVPSIVQASRDRRSRPSPLR